MQFIIIRAVIVNFISFIIVNDTIKIDTNCYALKTY